MTKTFQAETRSIFHSKAHDIGIHDRFAVVAQRDRARLLHFAYFRHCGSVLSARNCAYGIYFTEIYLTFPVFYIRYDNRVVANGVCVGHTAYLGITARNRRFGAAFYIFLTLVTRFAQVNVNIYQARQNVLARSVHRFTVFFYGFRNLRYNAVLDKYVRTSFAFGCNNRAVFYQKLHKFFPLYSASNFKTAMRTASPQVTCSLMQLLLPSIKAGVSSTPLFTGPG